MIRIKKEPAPEEPYHPYDQTQKEEEQTKVSPNVINRLKIAPSGQNTQLKDLQSKLSQAEDSLQAQKHTFQDQLS